MSAEAFERHYTPDELAELWHFNRTTIQRMFRDEPGVLKYSNSTRRKREYVTLRIPEHVVVRVYSQRTR